MKKRLCCDDGKTIYYTVRLDEIIDLLDSHRKAYPNLIDILKHEVLKDD